MKRGLKTRLQGEVGRGWGVGGGGGGGGWVRGGGGGGGRGEVGAQKGPEGNAPFSLSSSI